VGPAMASYQKVTESYAGPSSGGPWGAGAKPRGSPIRRLLGPGQAHNQHSLSPHSPVRIMCRKAHQILATRAPFSVNAPLIILFLTVFIQQCWNYSIANIWCLYVYRFSHNSSHECININLNCIIYMLGIWRWSIHLHDDVSRPWTSLCRELLYQDWQCCVSAL